MPKMSTPAESIKGPEALPEGEYTVRMTGFKPKFSKDKGSVNLNPQMEIQGHHTPSGRSYFAFFNLNSKAPWTWVDFVHAFGMHLEQDPATKELSIPGVFDGPQDDPEKWQYKGPLIGRSGKVYQIQETYNGKPQNKIKYFVCAVPNCNTQYPDIRHSTDLTGKKA